MSEINWPIPSFIGEIYTSPLGKSWRWNGYAWDFVGPDYAIGPTGPSGATGPSGSNGVDGADGSNSLRWEYTFGTPSNGEYSFISTLTQNYINISKFERNLIDASVWLSNIQIGDILSVYDIGNPSVFAIFEIIDVQDIGSYVQFEYIFISGSNVSGPLSAISYNKVVPGSTGPTGPTGATGTASVYGEPWGIFDSNGNVTTYPTFASAKAASSSFDTIHMFCNVTETSDVSLDVSGVSVDFNGHVYILDYDSSTPSITCISEPSFLYNGLIQRQSSSMGAETIFTNGSLLHLDGLFLFSTNTPLNGGTITSISSDILSNQVSVGADGGYSLYLTDNTKLSNVTIFDGGDIYVSDSTIFGISGSTNIGSIDSSLTSININGVIVASGGEITQSSFINTFRFDTDAVTVTSVNMTKVSGIVTADGTGNGIKIIQGPIISEIIDCVGKSNGKGYSGILVTGLTSP